MGSKREYINRCLLKGERIQYVYEEHCRVKVLGHLKAMAALEGTANIGQIPEEDDGLEMLWVIQNDEVVEKGVYSRNKPKEELLVLAPPALMALVMGEYELSKELCEQGNRCCRQDEAVEILQDSAGPLLQGGTYDFCEACLLGSDMPVEQTVFFEQKGCFDIAHYCTEKSFFSQVHFHGDKSQAWKCVYQMLERVMRQEEACENFKDIKHILVAYAFKKKMDMDNEGFWKELYGLFADDPQWIMEAVHACLLSLNSVMADTTSEKYRAVEGMEEHFRHASCVSMNGKVGKYVSRIVADEEADGATRQTYCRKYFSVVRRFEGELTAEWRDAMLVLLKKRDYALLELAFRNCFLCRERIDEYIEYFILQKEYSWILPYLIQKNWLIKEDANGNIQ